VVGWVFVLNGLLILAFWWTSSGPDLTANTAGALNSVGRVTALLGTYLALCQLLLLSRIPALEATLGMQTQVRLHRKLGYWIIGLISAHVVFQTWAYTVAHHLSVLDQYGDWLNNYPWMLPAVLAMALLVLVVVGSITIARRHMTYETWYFIHLYAYLAVALAFGHQLLVGVDFLGNPNFTAYWVGLYIVVVALLLYYRLSRPLLLLNRHRFKVARVDREGPNVFSIYVTGRGLDRFKVAPGQFLVWRFLDRTRWSQAHPFSVSAVPDGRQLRLTFKNVGDYTARLAQVAPGTAVLIEGPFGDFTPAACHERKALMVAGGSGISAVLPVAAQLHRGGVDVRLLYSCRRERDFILTAELDELGLGVDYLTTAADQSASYPWLEPARLQRLVPDVRQREVFLCGPPGLVAAVARSLSHLQVEPNKVHSEVYRY
jgi:predicted ferric reductase